MENIGLLTSIERSLTYGILDDPPFLPLPHIVPSSCPPRCLVMNSKKKQRLCLCSKCKILTYKERNADKPGQLIDYRKWNQHAADDELRVAEEDHLLYTALVTAIAPLRDKPSSEPSEDAVVCTVLANDFSLI